MKPAKTERLMECAFRDGEIKTAGTDIGAIMPPVSRFGGNARLKKKQKIIDRLESFFEQYFGLCGPIPFTEQDKMLMAAEPKTTYTVEFDT